MKKITRISGIIFCIIFLFTSFSGCNSYYDNKINDDFGWVLTDEKYQEAVFVDNLNVIKQEISCGYAVIEMLSSWRNGGITEESLQAKYEKVVTSTAKAFEKEMNKQFPQFDTMMYEYCTNSDVLIRIHASLKMGMPVPITFAAIYDDGNEKVWTLHYGIVTGLDIPNDSVRVANPYGYDETYSIEDFLRAMRFESYVDMPGYLEIAFGFGIFEKNTVFILSEK